MSIMVLKNDMTSLVIRARSWAVVCLTAMLLAISAANAEEQETWSRGLQFESANSADRVRGLSLYNIDQGKFHLIGTWWYENGALGNQTTSRIVIKGRKTSDGAFWPDVKLQVKDERNGKWQTVAKSSSEGQPATVIIEPNSRNVDLRVNLDALKPLIGKYKLGRLVLKTGEAPEFELKYLLPPEQAVPGDR